MLLAASIGVWVVWLVVGGAFALFCRPALIPAAIIFGIGLACGWWN